MPEAWLLTDAQPEGTNTGLDGVPRRQPGNPLGFACHLKSLYPKPSEGLKSNLDSSQIQLD
jgi:hypothetical protein